MSKAALLILRFGFWAREGTRVFRKSNPFLMVQRRFCSAMETLLSSRIPGFGAEFPTHKIYH